jgi:hypothetical protein
VALPGNSAAGEQESLSLKPASNSPDLPRSVLCKWVMQRGAPSRSPGVELLRLSREQSVYRTDLVHNDVRLRHTVPAEHVDELRPQMLEVA